jgi:hypothetical protein
MVFPTSHQKSISRGNATISGQLDFNGVPPENGTVALYAAPEDSNNFELIQNGIQAQDVVKWEWQGAQNGKMYQVKATLLDGSGKQIAQSNVITVAAPATDELLTINSPFVPQVETAASLSGAVGLVSKISSTIFPRFFKSSRNTTASFEVVGLLISLKVISVTIPSVP